MGKGKRPSWNIDLNFAFDVHIIWRALFFPFAFDSFTCLVQNQDERTYAFGNFGRNDPGDFDDTVGVYY